MSQTDNNLGYSADVPLDVAIWIDPVMLAKEAAFVRHLVMGMVADGHRVTFIARQGMDLTSVPTFGGRLLEYSHRAWERVSVLQRWRLSGVVADLKEDMPDVLLVWGSAGLADAGALSILLEETGLPTVLWVWDGSELFAPLVTSRHLKQVVVSSSVIAGRVPTGFGVPVTLIEPGVYAEESVACYDVETQWPCLISLDPLSDVKAYEALIRACRRLADERLDFLVFAYDTGRQEHPIWQLAEKLKLLERISFVPFQQDAEPLLLHGDLYIHVLPTSRVQYRTLDAMARGLAVVTTPNPGADYLVEGQTARVVSSATGDPSAEAWYGVLRELIVDREKTIQMAKRGQQMVREKHAMSRTLGQFASVCRQAAGVPLRMKT